MPFPGGVMSSSLWLQWNLPMLLISSEILPEGQPERKGKEGVGVLEDGGEGEEGTGGDG